MTERLGVAIGRTLQGGDTVALEGSLGAGKTRLVRGIAGGLGLEPDVVSSPTFVLIQEYGPTPDGLTLAHADAYRLGGTDDLDAIGWDELAGVSDVVTIVEWASRITDAMPIGTVWIDLETDVDPDAIADGPGTVRRITARGPSDDATPTEAIVRVMAVLDAFTD